MYFEQTRRLKNISLEDLGSVLCILHQSSKENTVEAESEPVINYSVGENTVEAESEPVINYSVGEHVAVFWREDGGGFRWYLGVVNELSEDENELLVSYYKRGKQIWDKLELSGRGGIKAH